MNHTTLPPELEPLYSVPSLMASSAEVLREAVHQEVMELHSSFHALADGQDRAADVLEEGAARTKSELEISALGWELRDGAKSARADAEKLERDWTNLVVALRDDAAAWRLALNMIRSGRARLLDEPPTRTAPRRGSATAFIEQEPNFEEREIK